MRNAFISLFLFLSITALALAADVTGTWKGELATPDGTNRPMTYNFKQDGEKFTGTVVGPQGEPIEIAEGKISGDQISFIIVVPMNGGMKIAHTGKVTGTQIDLKLAIGDDQTMSVTVKKQ